MIERSYGRLNKIKIKIKTKIKSMQFIGYFRYFYYKEIYLNPNLGSKLFNLYRLIIGILFIFIMINENFNYIYELLDIYINNYLQELSPTDCILLKMDSGGNANPFGDANPFGEGSSSNVPPGRGPSGNNPTGAESTTENENSKKKEQDSGRKANRRRGLLGPVYRYYDRSTHKYVYPEAYHEDEPIYLGNKTTRIYSHGGITYTYVCEDYFEDNRYCKITYPDGTYAFIFDKETVMNHIDYHRKHIKLGHQSNPPFSYADYYREHFDVFRKKKVQAFFENK